MQDNNSFQLSKENCIFCKIVNKEIDSKIVFEDELCMAVLDINPANSGHILLMPKEHYILMHLVPDHTLGHLAVISKYLSDLLIQTLGCVEVSSFIENGAAAGQQAQHFMVHLIPQYKNSMIDFSTNGSIDEYKLEELSKLMKKKLQEANNN